MPGKKKISKTKRSSKSPKKRGTEIEKLKKQVQSLRQKCSKQTLQAELFKEIGYVTSKGFKLDRFLGRLMNRVRSVTMTESASLLLLDESEWMLEFAVITGDGAKDLTGYRMPADEGIAGKVIDTGTYHISNEVKKDKIWSSRVAKEIDYETINIAAFPLKIQGKVKGVIELINKKDKKPFEKEDISLMKTLAVEVAVALENARLLTEARRRAQDFSTLSRLATILNSSLDHKSVRNRAMESVVELLDCETGSLYLIDSEKNELYFEVALGEKGEVLKEIRLKMGEGVAGWVAQEGKSDLVPDTSTDPRWASRVDKKSKFQTNNMVTVPVKAKGKVIGVLQAINKLHGKKVVEEDLILLESLADQVAIALENARLYEEMKEMFKQTSEALATAIEKRDPYTGGHTKRVRDFCVAAAQYMKLAPETEEWLEIAAILHDTGKIGVDDHVLRKPGHLSDDEFKMMKMHPVYGYDILQHVTQLGPAIPGMKHHHERFDGRGYPEGLSALDIPLIARIIAVGDTWDAMTSDRPYRKALPDEVANEELRKFSGTQFDPAVVKAFLKAYKNGEIKSQHAREKGRPKKSRGKQKAVAKPRGYQG